MGSSKAKTDHWKCALESHKDVDKHYHISIKLTSTKRKLCVKNHYYTSIKYLAIFLTITIKLISTLSSHENAYTSHNHPNLKETGNP